MDKLETPGVSRGVLRWIVLGLALALAAVLAFSLTGCVATSGDIDEIGAHQVAAGQAILAAAQDPNLDLHGALEAVGTAMVNAGEGTRQVAVEREDIGKSAGAGVLNSLGPWGEAAVELIALIAGLYGLNKVRNQTRKTDPNIALNVKKTGGPVA